jgi:hypothetical protein
MIDWKLQIFNYSFTVRLSLRRSTPRVPGILPTHRPRAFGEAFGIGLDGIELFVK